MTNMYRVTGPDNILRKVFGDEHQQPMSATNIVSRLEDANTEGLFWNFWDPCKGPLVGVDSFRSRRTRTGGVTRPKAAAMTVNV